MNIMLFSHICGKEIITGAEKYLLALAHEWGRSAHCTLVVPEEGLLYHEAVQSGMAVIVHPIPLHWQMFDPGPTLRSEVTAKLEAGEHGALINLLHMHQPDLVVTNTCLNVLPAAAAKALGIPVAWFLTEKIIENGWSGQTVEWIDRYADWIVGISETTLRPIRSRSGTEGKLFLLPPYLRLEDFHPDSWPASRAELRSRIGVPDNDYVVGFISSSLHEEKGLEHFVTMALQVAAARSGTHFVIVGGITDPVLFDRCFQMIDKAGFAPRFHHIAFESRIETLFPAMDVVAVPSLIDEGFGLTALEGLLFGKSVVAYRAGGLEEILQATGNAAGLTEKGNVPELTDRVLSLLANGPILAAKAVKNREEVESVYGKAAFARRLKSITTVIEARCAHRRSNPTPPALSLLKDGHLYKGEHSSVVFLVQQGVKRPFASPEAFSFYRYRWEEIATVPELLLQQVPTGPAIRHFPASAQNRPCQLLAQGSGHTVYWLSGGRRHRFTSRRALQIRGFDPSRIVRLPDEELLALPEGDALNDPHAPKRTRRKRRRLVRRGLRPGRRVRAKKRKTVRRTSSKPAAKRKPIRKSVRRRIRKTGRRRAAGRKSRRTG